MTSFQESFLEKLVSVHFGGKGNGLLILYCATGMNGVSGQTDASMLSGVTITTPDGKTYAPLIGDIPTLLPVDPQVETYIIDYNTHALPSTPIWKEAIFGSVVTNPPPVGLWEFATRTASSHGTRVFVNLDSYAKYADANGYISFTLHVPEVAYAQEIVYGNQQWSNFGAQSNPSAWLIPDGLGQPIMAGPTTANTYPGIPHPDLIDDGWAGAYATAADAIAHDIAAGQDPSNYTQYTEPFNDELSIGSSFIELFTYRRPNFTFHSIDWSWEDTAVSVDFFSQASVTHFIGTANTQTFKVKVKGSNLYTIA